LHVINTESSVHEFTIEPMLPPYGAVWVEQNKIAYSLREKQQWQRYEYSLELQQSYRIDDNWAFKLADNKQTIMIDQSFAIFVRGESRVTLNCAPILIGQRLTITVRDGFVYCINANNRADLLQYGSVTNQDSIRNAVSDHQQFSIAGDRFTKTEMKQSTSDIMRTLSVAP